MDRDVDKNFVPLALRAARNTQTKRARFADWKKRSPLFLDIQASPSIPEWQKMMIERMALAAYKAGRRAI